MLEPYIIGIAGGSASGKTSVSQRIIQQLQVSQVALISADSFYKPLTETEIQAAYRNDYDFDHPDAFDSNLLSQVLFNLKKRLPVNIPVYDFATHSRLDKTTVIKDVNVIIFEGLFVLYHANIRELMDLLLFVDTDADVRLVRRCIDT
jgi:uridine kinase